MRTCLFCHKTASTKEDAMPLWLVKRFNYSNKSLSVLECGGHNPYQWPTTKPKLQLKWLCSFCNSGWMSKLETEAKPVMESILDGILKSIDVSAQLTLARWAVKTAMVLEAINSSRSKFYSADERQLMRTEQAIPQHTEVWIAMCVDQPNINYGANDHKNSSGDHAFVNTMAFGSLALQVVSIKTPAVIPENAPLTYDVREGPWEQTLVQVWPINQNSLAWPPYKGQNGELGLYELKERLSPIQDDPE